MSKSKGQSIAPGEQVGHRHEMEVAHARPTTVAPRPMKPRGFAAMSPDMQRDIASRGGLASAKKGTGHKWTTDSARSAGRKGGLRSHGKDIK